MIFLRIVACFASLLVAIADVSAQSLSIEQSRREKVFILDGAGSSRQLVVTELTVAKKHADLTRDAKYSITPANIARIDANGFVTPLQEGQGTITAKLADGRSTSLPVKVANMRADHPVHFNEQIVPLFSKFGCNTGGCHGKTGGQNGFALSLFGFEPQEDFEALVKESRVRRIVLTSPDASLLLAKPAGTMSHGGGRKFQVDSAPYRIVRRWIEQGLPAVPKNVAEVTGIEVLPQERTLAQSGQQQLAVIAHRADGTSFDATAFAQFEVNDTELAEVSSTGLVKAKARPGSFSVMARYQTHVDVFRALVPLGAPIVKMPAANNFIDTLVFKRLNTLGLPPSEFADDMTFLRRVTVDLAGRLPTIDETKAFLASKDTNRREQAVDKLLASPDYAYYFANKWGAILRNRRKSDKDDPKITAAFHKWIKESLEQNKPYDQFVREIVTVTGPHTEKPMVAWYREVNSINEQVEDVTQLFLGQRIMCARCHHHPLEKWSQQDYYGFAAFFSRVEFKSPPPPKKDKGAKVALPQPAMTVMHKPGLAESKNPRTGLSVRPTGLGSMSLSLKADDDPRVALVDWMADKNNPYFAKALANRYWKHFFGRGLNEPEDDMRVTNPPSNPELLEALAKHFADNKYDLKNLVRTMVLSNAYRLSSEPNEHNAGDRQNFSRFQLRRLTAEVFLDAIDDLAQIRSTFKGMPAGTRAIQLPDNQVDSYFLSVFGRPDFASACECERSGDANLAQSLHMVNSKDVMNKLDKGRATKLAKDTRPHAERVREIYLLAYSREPSAEETRAVVAYVERVGNAQRAYEDLLWTIVNTKEFMFNH
ncbi:MAG: DUF1553 domain-containing protein [Gemmataceae bacterium]|nr:DUF1553 domain-containing protein [Gemmataceae bacterium]